jgi:ABC-2 type transport system permease protein
MLVASREFGAKVRAKSFIFGTLAMMVAVVVLSLLPRLGGDGETRVGVSPEYGSSQALVEAASASGLDLRVTEVTGEPEEVLASSDLSAVVTGTPEAPVVTVERDPDAVLTATLTALAQQAALADEISSLGGDPAGVAASVAAVSTTVNEVEPRSADYGERLVVGFVLGLLLYSSLLTVGTQVSQGVVEEKTSRVVDLLLATITARQLLVGKVVGIGGAALAQLVVVGLTGAALVATVAEVSISLGSLVGTLLWALVWFLVGLVSYALLFAAFSATVSRQEEVSTVVSPLMMVLIIPYVLGAVTLFNDPESQVAAYASWVPLMAPMLMPWRLALGVVSLPEALIVLGASVVVVPLLAVFAAKVYSNSILHMGQRVKVSKALSSTSS